MNKDDRKVIDFHMRKIMYLENDLQEIQEQLRHHRSKIMEWAFPDEVEE